MAFPLWAAAIGFTSCYASLHLHLFGENKDLLEHRTGDTDAFDTLYIGCEKFPQHDLYPTTLNGIKQLLHHSLNEKKQYLCKQEFKTNYRYEQAFNYAIFIVYCCDIKQLR